MKNRIFPYILCNVFIVDFEQIQRNIHNISFYS